VQPAKVIIAVSHSVQIGEHLVESSLTNFSSFCVMEETFVAVYFW
jgi:hypothetical protein